LLASSSSRAFTAYVSFFKQLLMVFLATSTLSVSVSFLLPVAFQ
jgi:hypothetical protein